MHTNIILLNSGKCESHDKILMFSRSIENFLDELVIQTDINFIAIKKSQLYLHVFIIE